MTHSLDNILDRQLSAEHTNFLDKDQVFEMGFTAYADPINSIFLNLEIDSYVKTTCPINGSEDIIKVWIRYNVNKFGHLIEHHSFLNWLDSFEGKGFGLEATCSTIYEMVDKVISPTKLYVRCESHSNFRATNTATREKDF